MWINAHQQFPSSNRFGVNNFICFVCALNRFAAPDRQICWGFVNGYKTKSKINIALQMKKNIFNLSIFFIFLKYVF